AAHPLAESQSSPVTAMVAVGDVVITGHHDGFVRVWRLPDLTLSAERKLDAAIESLTDHGTLLAVAETTGRIVLLDDALNPVRVLQQQGNTPHDLHFSPDGRQLAAGNWFRMQLWDVATGEQKTIPTEHKGLLVSLDYSPDGQYLVTLGRHTD